MNKCLKYTPLSVCKYSFSSEMHICLMSSSHLKIFTLQGCPKAPEQLYQFRWDGNMSCMPLPVSFWLNFICSIR